jgi:hypothetical protein
VTPRSAAAPTQQNQALLSLFSLYVLSANLCVICGSIVFSPILCHLPPTLRIRRVFGPADVAALAVHIMTNTSFTGATFDIDGGQQFVAG